MNQGFYKNENGNLLSAANRVTTPNNTLLKQEKDSYVYPIEGWYWFDSEEDAYNFWGLEINEIEEEEEEEEIPQNQNKGKGPPAFYKYDSSGDILYRAQNRVTTSNNQLLRQQKDSYVYPIEGWYWFNSLTGACAFWDLEVYKYREEEEEEDEL